MQLDYDIYWYNFNQYSFARGVFLGDFKICVFIVFIKFGTILAIISLTTFSVTISPFRAPVIHIKKIT